MTLIHESDFRNLFVGVEAHVPVLDGSMRPYINLDNAASTPACKRAAGALNQGLTFYSSVHRGTGFKSQLSTRLYEQARLTVLRFLHANPDEHVCIFGKNATEALNKLARRFPFTPERNIVLVSLMEHHSNDLPWRPVANLIHVAVTPDGRLDEDDFDRQLARYAERVALVSISGASNVTGFQNPIHRLAEKAHAVGAQIAVDCAQLAPHRSIDVRPLSDAGHLDYVAISAHKMYAPFGTGALVGRRDTFAQGDPDLRGGGEVELVTLDSVHWSAPPDRDEAGSPNTLGAIALAAAIEQLEEIGMPQVAAHEAELTAHALARLPEVPGLVVLGDSHPDQAASRLGVIPVYLTGVSHFLAAAVLGYEFAIGVRNGCFCAHPYILHLLQVPADEVRRVRAAMLTGDRRDVPGLVRISFGLYNTLAEVDACVDALKSIAKGAYQGAYFQDTSTGEYHPQGWQVDYSPYSPLNLEQEGASR
ncbi:MAG: aminotransferase class V-fold PLP-dependent enzyme [Anaerolineaceae bacterium]|nr:aminotransferase class V-fold PLP-dependent enzyme [Anaerolineaceae bacterium]